MSSIISRSKFFKLSPADRRVQIAKDILFRLKSEHFTALNGVFTGVNTIIPDKDLTPKDVEDNQCEVCAKGAIACSWFINLNKHNFSDFSLSSDAENDAMKELIGTFGKDIWNVLECLFENFDISDYETGFDENQKNEIQSYASRLDKYDANEVMFKLFTNIVRNNGSLLIPNSKKKKGFLIN